MTCEYCKNDLVGEPIKVEPSRHLTSPNSINYGIVEGGRLKRFYWYFCSKECERAEQKRSYAWWAELDRNASDSECFEHLGWHGKMRVGRCKITGKRFEVEPLQPGNNSGQPIECEQHFKLRSNYSLS